MMVLDTLFSRLKIQVNQRHATALRTQAMTPFSGNKSHRILLVTQGARIPQSQIYPFHYYTKDLRHLYDAEVREVDLDDVIFERPLASVDATVVAFQTSFDISDDYLIQLVQRLRHVNPAARLVGLDWSSPLDLRNAERFDPFVEFYVKKHVFRNRMSYWEPTQGDTNLTDYYGRRFNLNQPTVQHHIPEGFLNKLIVGPSFATAPVIMPFLLGRAPSFSNRPIDLHARFAVDGTPWYRAMRSEAKACLASVADLNVAHSQVIPLYKFLTEMQRSKLCFSPFGYGEVCWRDYEAILAGAVLLKPDMDHVETDPNIFIPWETYVPLRWDLTDFEEIVRYLCAVPKRRELIARQAFKVLQEWLLSDRFSLQLKPIFV